MNPGIASAPPNEKESETACAREQVRKVVLRRKHRSAMQNEILPEVDSLIQDALLAAWGMDSTTVEDVVLEIAEKVAWLHETIVEMATIDPR